MERRHFKRAYLLANGLEFALALAAVVTGIVFLLVPDALAETSVAVQAGWFAYAWNVGYMLGGALTAVGLAADQKLHWPREAWELAGISLLVAGILINAIAVASIRGFQGTASVITYLGLAVALAGRAWIVYSIARRGVATGVR